MRPSCFPNSPRLFRSLSIKFQLTRLLAIIVFTPFFECCLPPICFGQATDKAENALNGLREIAAALRGREAFRSLPRREFMRRAFLAALFQTSARLAVFCGVFCPAVVRACPIRPQGTNRGTRAPSRISAHPASPNTAHAFAFLSLRLSARAISERFARRTCLHVRARASAFAPAPLFRGKVAFLLLCRLIPRQALPIDFRARSARCR